MSYRHQFCFQERKSIRIALVILIGEITEALDQGECIIVFIAIFSRLLIQLFIKYHYKGWHGVVFKISC